MSSKIPRIVMRTWKTKNIPDHWKNGTISISTHLKDWKHVLMTDIDNRNFVKTHFPMFLSCYDSFPYSIQRADAIRYMWLYINGGVYMDLDFEILRPLDSLFSDGNDLYVVKSYYLKNVYTNSFIACRPGLQVMLDCLEEMKKDIPSWCVGKHLTVVHSTGPMMFTRAIVESKLKSNYDYVIGDLDPDIMMACYNLSSSNGGQTCLVPDGAYCKILGGTSWSGMDTECLSFAFHKRYFIITVIVIIIVVLIFLMLNRRVKLYARR